MFCITAASVDASGLLYSAWHLHGTELVVQVYWQQKTTLCQGQHHTDTKQQMCGSSGVHTPEALHKVQAALVLSHRRALHELLHGSSQALRMTAALLELLTRQQQPVEVEPGLVRLCTKRRNLRAIDDTVMLMLICSGNVHLLYGEPPGQ